MGLACTSWKEGVRCWLPALCPKIAVPAGRDVSQHRAVVLTLLWGMEQGMVFGPGSRSGVGEPELGFG